MTDLRKQAEAWIADDPDPDTRAELHALLDDGPALQARFGQPLAFGTAGLRGRLGAGAGRMNRRVVAMITAGLCRHLASVVPNAKGRGLCIGRDARHGSASFATEAAQVALGEGFRVHYFEQPVPTPLVAFATPLVHAAGGIVITASHNPPQDNGCKVYSDHGALIIPPQDANIAQAASEVSSIRSLTRVSLDDGRKQGMLSSIDTRALQAYRAGVTAAFGKSAAGHDLRIAYTPLHGVGGALAMQVLADAGFSDVHPIADQYEPDPDFPTVRFPNPEEAGTLDALIDAAQECAADLALAHDPDADRLAVCARDGQGDFRMLNGNETGALLMDYALSRSTGVERPLVCFTVVSSPLAARVARAHGARAETTLTGFKWICSRAMALEQQGYQFVFGFEEALGYAAHTLVRDKDGLSAAVLAAQLAVDCKTQGQSLWDRLDGLYATHGYHDSAQEAPRLAGQDALTRARALVARLRAHPPTTLADLPVLARSDLLQGIRWDARGQHQLATPRGDVLIFELADDRRVCIRPSGTEPKLKFYFDVRTCAADGEPSAATRARGARRLETLRSGVLADLQVLDTPS